MATTIDQAREAYEAVERLRMERFMQLVESFPSLRDKPGVRPWDQHEFARWASGPARTSGNGQAAAFILGVWNGACLGYGEPTWFNDGLYQVGTFDPVHALGIWDAAHAAAFVAWCQAPFWP